MFICGMELRYSGALKPVLSLNLAPVSQLVSTLRNRLLFKFLLHNLLFQFLHHIKEISTIICLIVIDSVHL